LAKTFQEGRAPSNGANAPKNERSVTSAVFRFPLVWRFYSPLPYSILEGFLYLPRNGSPLMVSANKLGLPQPSLSLFLEPVGK